MNNPQFPAMDLLFIEFLSLLFSYEEIHTVQINEKSYTLNRNPDAGTTESDQFNLMFIAAYAVLGKDMTEQEFFDYLYANMNNLTIGEMDGGKIDIKIYAISESTKKEYTVDYNMEFYNKDHDVIIHYVDQDGLEVADDVRESYSIGETFSKDSPVLEDYTVDQDNISGTMGKTDQEYTVTYTIREDLVAGYYHYYLNDELWKKQTVPVGNSVNPLEVETEEGYSFSGWSWKNEAGESINTPETAAVGNYYAYGTYTLNSHDIIYNIDGTEVYRETVPYGAELKLKDADEKPGYVFSGWSMEDGTKVPKTMPDKDVVVRGAYSPIEYTVTFRDYNDSIITQKSDYHYGDALAVPSNPKRADNNTYTYKFLGWKLQGSDDLITSFEGAVVKANATYMAVYEEAYKAYTITFKDWDGEVISTKTYHYGDNVAEPKAPSREADTEYEYVFKGWDKNVTKVYGDATYTAVYEKDPIGYVIAFYDWNQRLISERVYGYGEPITIPADPTRAEDETYTYTFSGWSPSVEMTATGDKTYIAQYNETYKDYTIVFKNEDGSVINEKTYHYGDTIEVPAAPAKESNDTYTYVFDGWGSEVTTVKGDAVYQAVFKPVYKEYTVTFAFADGTVIDSKTYHYGDTVTEPAEPKKASDVIFDYHFTGWDKAVSKVTGNSTYIAQFEAVYVEYKITFLNWNDTLLAENTYHYQETLKQPETPVRAEDNTYTYVFEGWEPVLETLVTKAATYKAVFASIFKTYTITFVDDEGKIIAQKTDYHYGDTVEAPANPQKAENGAYTYTFKGWDKDITEVKGNTTYTAIFQQTQKEYTVKFLNFDGSLISETTYHYGDAVKMPMDPESYEADGRTYSFSHWEPVVEETVTGNATYTAQFIDEANSVTVNFYNHDGTKLLYKEAVNVGDDVDVTDKTAERESTNYYTYDFAQWVTAVNGTEAAVFENVTEDFAVYASFTKTVRNYTVTFLDEDGSEISSKQDYHYSNTIQVPENPTKPADKENTYVFAGWDQEPTVVTGNMVFKAIYQAVPIEYTVTFLVDGKTHVKKLHYGDPVSFDGSVDKTDTDQYDYTFTGWKKTGNDEVMTSLAQEKVTKEVSYEAVYETEVKQYIVTFYDETGNVILGTKTVDYGDAAAFVGETPDKAQDPVNTYVFHTWVTEAGGNIEADLTAIKHNLKVYASFAAVPRNYTAVIFDAAGTVINEKTYAYGETLEDIEPPTKDADPQYTYTFAYWERNDGQKVENLADEFVTGDVSYRPVFDQTAVTYQVTWIVEGVETTETYLYHDTLKIPTAPSKENTAKYTYTFAGWTKNDGNEILTDLSSEKVTADTTYTAQFKETINTHKVSFYCDDILVKTVTVNHGEAATEPEPLKKVSDAQFDYAFSHWEQDFSVITEDLRVDAVYTSTVRDYIIRWSVDGKVTETTCPYGEVPIFDGTPTKTETPKFKYVFTGWDVEPAAVTGPATYTAQFEEQNNYVATINGTYYKTIEAALANAKSGDAVMVEYDCTITEDTVVPKGVTLFLPCQDNDTVFIPSIETYNPEGTNVNGKETLYRQVTVAEGVKLDIEGTVIVNAITGRPRSSGDHDISGGYAEIVLNGQIHVKSGGLLDVYGYVRGDGHVTTESGAKIYDLYVVRNWRGGSQALSMYQEDVYPMNENDCHNISVPMNIVYGASYEGTVRMYADDGTGPRYYCTRFPQVNVSNGLYRLTSKDGYVVKSFDGEDEIYEIYGGADFSQSTLFIVAMNLSTGLFVYPIDGDMQFKLNGGEYHFKNDYKFLPGAEIEVSGDSKVIIGEEATVVLYREFNDVPNTGNTQYPADRDPVVMKMESGSEMEILGKFGGRIDAGKVKITRGNDGELSVTTKEANGYRNGVVRITNDFEAVREGFDGSWYRTEYQWKCNASAGHEINNWSNSDKLGWQKGSCENCSHTEERSAPAAYLMEAIDALAGIELTETKLETVEALRGFYAAQNQEVQEAVINIEGLEAAEAEAAMVAALREGYKYPSIETLTAGFVAYDAMSAAEQNHADAIYTELVQARDAFVSNAKVENLTVDAESLESVRISWLPCDDASRYEIRLLDQQGNTLETVEKAATAYEFTGLEQMTSYQISVKPILEINGTSFTGKEALVWASTLLSEVQNLHVKDIQMDSVTVTWQAPSVESERLDGYKLVLQDIKGDLVDESFTEDREWTFSNLKQGTAYHVSVYPSFIMENASQLGLVQTVETATVPGSVSEIGLTDLHASEASFTWEEPKAAAAAGLVEHGYQVILKHEAGETVKTVETEALNIQFADLKADSNYQISIKPLYTFNGNPCTTAAVDFAFSTLPDTVENVKVTAYDSDKLTVGWDAAPAASDSKITLASYQIQLKNDSGAVLDTVKTDKTNWTFDGLREETIYQMTVSAIYRQDNQFYEAEETTITGGTLPGAVQGLHADNYETERLSFSWIPQNELLVSSYRLTLKTADGSVVGSVDAKMAEAVFDGLSGGTVYTLTVQPIYRAGGTTWNGEIASVTASTLPGAVTKLTLDGFTKDSLAVSWQAPEQHHSDAIFAHYDVALTKLDGQIVQRAQTTADTYIFTGLQEAETYKVTVIPVFYAGGKECQGTSSAIEADTMVSSVKAMAALEKGTTSFRLVWQKSVSDTNTRMKDVQYTVVLKNHAGDVLKTIKTRNLEHVFDGLTAGSQYTVSVVPTVSINGTMADGSVAELSVTTLTPQTPDPEPEDPPAEEPDIPQIPDIPSVPNPEEPETPQLPDAPGALDPEEPEVPQLPDTPSIPNPEEPEMPQVPDTPVVPEPEIPQTPEEPTTPETETIKVAKASNLKVSVRNTGSIKLTWKRPSGKITGYKVQRFSTKTGKALKTVYISKLSYQFNGLKAGTAYKFSVTPYVKDNSKKVYGPAISLKTVTKPAKVSIKSLKTGSKKLTITWKKATCTKYQVYVAKNKTFTKGLKKYNLSAKYTKKTLTKLKKGTKYYVKVRAIKVYNGKTYYGQWSTVKQKTVK